MPRSWIEPPTPRVPRFSRTWPNGLLCWFRLIAWLVEWNLGQHTSTRLSATLGLQSSRSRTLLFFLSNRIPESSSSQRLRTRVPNTIQDMVFGTRVLKYWLLGIFVGCVALVLVSARFPLGVSPNWSSATKLCRRQMICHIPIRLQVPREPNLWFN